MSLEDVMKNGSFVLAVIFLLFFQCQGEGAEAQWVHTGTSGGVESYERPVNGSAIKEYRAVCVMNHSIETLLEVLIDVPSYPLWMPDCMEARILKEFKKGLERGNYHIYLKMDGIWPARNRDLVIESVPKTDWEAGVSTIRLKKLDGGALPEQEGFVRIVDFMSEFKLEIISRDKTLVTMTTFVDVGGWIPPFIAAVQTQAVPLGTLAGLGRMAAEPRYQKAAARDYF